MRQIAKRFWAAGACVLAASLFGVSFTAAQAPVTVTRTADLSAPRVDALGDGTIVVSLDARGDLAGSVTLTLTPKGDGTYGGHWAMTVGHTDNTDPATGVDPGVAAHEEHADGGQHTHAEEPHRDFARYVHRGGMNGTITGATLVFGPDGLADLVANLAIEQGAMEFENITGTGSATLSSLTLTF